MSESSKPSATRPPRTRRIIRVLLASLGVVVAVPVGLLGFFQATEFDPPSSLALSPIGASPTQDTPTSLALMTWNIGYAGLDRQTDFFMDGGKMPGPRSREAVEQNLKAVRSELVKHAADAIFVQEVDHTSSRTYDIDEVTELINAFPKHQGWYGINFRSPFVPVPVSSPIGHVESGLLFLLRSPAREATREQLPGSYSWPTRMFHLKRCAVFAHVPSSKQGKDWVLINVHLSAFDDGTMREQQSAFLRQRMLALYEQGHFVVIGGDWNMVLPGVTSDAFGPSTTSKENLAWLKTLPDDWTPEGWTWAVDAKVPSVRTNEQPYREGENHRTVIDGFLLSPNVRLESVRGVDLGFEHSDHQPVLARVSVRD